MTVLCPQLTVPSNSECVLAVPSLLDVEHGSLVSRNLTDKDGLPLLRVGFPWERTSSHGSMSVETDCVEDGVL